MPDAIPLLDETQGVSETLARGQVLFTDLDGTLLGRGASLLADGAGRPSPDTAEAIVDVNRAGLGVVITSGRNAKQLREITRLLGWTDFIAELGCVRSYDSGEHVVYETGDWPAGALPEGETPYEAIEREGAVALLRRMFPGRIESHDPWHVDRQATHILRGNVPILEAQAALDTLPLPVTIVDNGVIHPRDHHLVGVTEVHAIHLVPTGASKERSVAAYLVDRCLARAQALAIGDSAADVAMAGVVSLMACVANGLDDPLLQTAAKGRSNIVVTRGGFGSGWAEFARAWIAARAGALPA